MIDAIHVKIRDGLREVLGLWVGDGGEWPVPRTALSGDNGDPVVVGMAAVDGSGRVRERAVLAALGWDCGDALEIQIAGDIAIVRVSPTDACASTSAARSPCPPDLAPY
jgi:hypothetical protein